MPYVVKRDLHEARLAARYQPIVSVAERRAIGLEVLARLEHPRNGVLAPEHFVPQMEDAGLARMLTESVAALAFEEYGQHLCGSGLGLAVNFPLDVLLDCATLTALDGKRCSAGVDAGQILIELTESRPLNPQDGGEMRAFGAMIRHLRDLGFGLALDDVGPDTANLRLLLDCGFTAVKLDRAVVEASATAPCARRFLRETIAAATAGGLTVIAEGVEDEAGWERMRDLGADQVQGYFVSRPLRAAEVGAWRADWQHAPLPR